jgi:hypothetical protein
VPSCCRNTERHGSWQSGNASGPNTLLSKNLSPNALLHWSHQLKSPAALRGWRGGECRYVFEQFLTDRYEVRL